MKRFVGLVAVVALLASGCSTAGGSAIPANSATSSGPSESALMICAPEAQAAIQDAVGVPVASPPTSTYADHVFTCEYRYGGATMVLSVKDLADKPATDAYYADARARLKTAADIPGLGEGAMSDNVSTVYVRKDFKVLRVDTSGLPVKFGQPPHSRYTIAVAVAAAITLCWTGA